MSALIHRLSLAPLAALKGLARLLAVLAALVLLPGAALAAITFNNTVSGGSSAATRLETIHYTQPASTPTGQYVGLSFTSSTPIYNVYARAIVGGTGYALNTKEPANHFIGDLSTTLRTSYWFINLPTAGGSGTFQVEIWSGIPAAAGSTLHGTSSVYTLSSVDTDQAASANKINSFTVSPTLQLGQAFDVVVCYDFNSTAGTNLLVQPAALSSYDPADSLLAIAVELFNTGGNSDKCNLGYVTTLQNQLYFLGTTTAASSARVTYTFRARGPSALSLTPVGVAQSGQYKFNSDFATGRPLPAPTNSVTIGKSVDITASAGATTVTYTLTATNAGTQAVMLDAFVDTLPSSPAAVGYVAGSTKFNGVTIADPLTSGQTLTWGNPGGSNEFSIPAGGSRSLTFQATIPATYGDYTNSAHALIGDVMIDTTLSMLDTAPATAMTRIGPQVAGRVFEDVNYGGGAGRACGAASGSSSCTTTTGAVGRSGARVEIYNNATGAFVAATTTDANGDYGFSGLSTGNYTVRVVNSTVTSSRTGYLAGLLPVQTYRAEAPAGDSTAVTDRVGGENPCSADAAANTTNATLASLTSGATVGGSSACSTAPVTQPQSVAVVYVDPSVSNVSLRKPSGTLDFGFNFDTIVNTRDSGQGSLRQFILNSNALGNTGLAQTGQTAGREVSIFMIPDGTARPGLRAGLTNQLATSGSNTGAAVVTLAGALPTITDASTSLDATTQTANIGDTNAGTLGSAGTVGTSALALSTVPRPELVIDANGLSGAAALDVSGAGAVLKGFAIYNHRPAGETAALANTTAVSLTNATSFTQLLVGTMADGSNPGGTLRNAGLGIGALGGASVTNSFLAYNGLHNLSFGSTASGTAAGNEMVGGAWNGATADSVRVLAKTVTLSGNLIRDLDTLSTSLAVGNGKGIEISNDADDVVIEDNTVKAMRTAGIGVHGGSDGVIVRRNIVTGTLGDGSAHSGAGILVSTGSGLGSGAPQRVKISQNSLYANAGLGLDLAASGMPDGVTGNDGSVGAAGPNNGIDYPVLDSAVLAGGTLTVSGHVGSAAGQAAFANVTIEFFVADNVPANQDGNVVAGDGQSVPHGEGRTYANLAQCTSDAGSGTFSCAIAVSGVGAGSSITATATDSLGNTSEFGANFAVTVLGVNVAGTVYADVNHNALLDSGESGTGQTVHVKLVPRSGGTCTGPATAAATVNGASGAYTLGTVSAGDWCLVLDDNATDSDVASNAPAGWLRTEAPTGILQITVGATDMSGQNFGLFNGSFLSGTVFRDTGVSGGTANDGVQNGGEPGLANVAVKATDGSGATTHDSTYTSGAGAYGLWIPATASGTVRIVETNLGGFVSTGGHPGNTGGSYTRSSDVVSFTHVVGSSYAGVNFGDVPDNAFTTDGVQGAAPGSTLWYTHNFTAGTAGSVEFGIAASASPAIAGWSEVFYRDANCNGTMDGTEGSTAMSGALAVSAGEQVCLLLKEFVPATAGLGAQNQVTVTASFTYVNAAAPTLSASYTRNDVTTVGEGAGLALLKSVDKAAALPGEVLTYTIVYSNNSSGVLSSVKINDSTPAFTTFASAECVGPLPDSLTACAASTQPTAGTAGAIEWTLTGTLAPGGSGTVRFVVTVDP